MCTVTYVPSREKLYITSNRDEKNWRSDALPPAVYGPDPGRAVYPKDGDAGGTWIAAHENGNIVVFLNGGIVAHTPEPPYRKSRGLILLDILDHYTPYNCFLSVNLHGIEPFTAVIRDNAHLFEARWDGNKKHSKKINDTAPHIWSSVTLYDSETIAKRKKWFDEWVNENPTPSQEEILRFHQFTGDGDTHNDLKMNRDGKVFTVSITSIELTNNKATMNYLDLKSGEQFREQLLFDPSTSGK